MGVLSDESTRLRFGLIIVAVTAIEALVTAFVPAFPFIAAAGIQAGVYTTFVTGRTITDIRADQITVNHED